MATINPSIRIKRGGITKIPTLLYGQLYLAKLGAGNYELWVGTPDGNILLACGCSGGGSGAEADGGFVDIGIEFDGGGSDTIPAPPLHWWTLDEGTGTLAEDTGTGTPMDGTLEAEHGWTADTGDSSDYAVEWSAESYLELADSEELSDLTAFTVTMLVRRSANQSGGIGGVVDNTGSWWFGVAGGSETGKTALGKRQPEVTPVTESVYSTGTIATGEWVRIAVTHNGSGQVKLYIANTLDSTHNGCTWAESWSGAGLYALQADSAGFEMDDVRIYGRVLTDTELGSFPPTPLVAAAGTFTLSGQAAALLYGRTLAAGAGSFTLAGQDAALLYGYKVAADVGVFTLSGQTADLRHWKLSAEVGSFTLTGQDATLTVGSAPSVPTATSCWHLDEASGTRTDSIGSNDLDEEAATTVTQEDGWVLTNAAGFAADASLEVAHDTTLAADAGWTVAVWFNANITNTGSLANKQSEWAFVMSNDYQVHFHLASYGSVAGGLTATPTMWNLIIAWYDAGSGDWGVSVNNKTPVTDTGATVPDVGSILTIGRDGSTRFNGRIGPVRWWKGTVLDATERTALWNDGSGLTCADASGPNRWPGTLRINMGTLTHHTDGSSNVWVGQGAVAQLTLSGNADYDAGSPPAISGTTEDVLYQTQAYSASWTATLIVPNGNYTLKLYFAEIGFSTVGARVFDVEIDSVVQINDLDVYAEVGDYAEHVETLSITVSGGQVEIGFVASVDTAFCNAIELIPV